METFQERQQRIANLEQGRSQRRAETVWPTPDNSGTGVTPIEIAPGRGNMNYSSGFYPTFPTALNLIGGKSVSFARLFQSQPWVAAAVMRMLTWSLRVPLHLYRRTGDDPTDRTRIHPGDHPLADGLENPWTGGNKAQLIMAQLGALMVHGNAVVLVEDGAGGKSVSFTPKDWRFTRPIMPWRDVLAGFEFDVDNPEFMDTASADKVLHTAYWSPIGPIGTSPLQQLGITLGIEDGAQRYQKALFANGARSGGAIKASEQFLGMDPKDRAVLFNELRKNVNEAYVGPDNSGRPLLLPPGLDWTPTTQTTAEAELINQRKITQLEICAVYQIQPGALGIMDKANYANLMAQREMCLPGDALVSTDRGPVGAADVRSGDRVWAVKDGRLQSSVVSWQAQTGVQPLTTIRTLDRTVRCTDNHPVLMARRVSGKVGRPKADGSDRRPASWRHEWVPAGEIKRGDLIVNAEKLPDYGVRSCPTRSEVSEGFAEFCGLWLGDGCIIKDKDNVPRRVMVTRADDARYMDHYRAVIRDEFRKMPATGFRSGAVLTESTAPVMLREHDRQTEFCSTAAASEIRELGFGESAHTKRVPEWVFQLAPDLRAAFLRGLFDADATVDWKGHIILAMCNETLVRQLRELCISIGLPVSNVRVKRGWATLPDGHKVFSVVWKFVAGNPQANAELVGSHDPQDLERMRSGRPWRRHYACPISIEGCGLSKVLAVEAGEVSVPVYNITVPDGQNFVVDGVVTHNTYTDSLGPPLVLIEQAFNAQVCRDLLREPDLFVEFDFSAVLRGDPLKEVAMIRDGIGAALMTPNEGRSVLNLTKSDNPLMDEFYMPVNNMQPIGSQPTGPPSSDSSSSPAPADSSGSGNDALDTPPTPIGSGLPGANRLIFRDDNGWYSRDVPDHDYDSVER